MVLLVRFALSIEYGCPHLGIVSVVTLPRSELLSALLLAEKIDLLLYHVG